VGAERSSVNLLVVVTKKLQLSLYWEEDAHLVLIWTLGSAVYCGNCKTFSSMSRIRQAAVVPICVKMFHAQYYLVAMVIHIPVQSLRSQVCVYIYTYYSQYRDNGGAK
jgi:hypothetical protein